MQECGSNGSVTMLAGKMSTGDTPEVDLNLRNALHAGNKHTSKESTTASKPRAEVTRVPEQEYQWPTKGLMPSKKMLKNYLSRSTQLDVIK